MNNVLIDTNVILDYVLLRDGFCDIARELLERLIISKSKIWLTASTITDIYYISKKDLKDGAAARQIIAKLLNTFQIADVNRGDCLNALDLEIDDYEDALVAVCAQKVKAQYIVTRNTKHFEGSPVKAISPEEILKML